MEKLNLATRIQVEYNEENKKVALMLLLAIQKRESLCGKLISAS